MVRPACVNKMFATRACRGSIMIGTPLDVKEMKKVLANKIVCVLDYFMFIFFSIAVTCSYE